jgi:hypothetical protein
VADASGIVTFRTPVNIVPTILEPRDFLCCGSVTTRLPWWLPNTSGDAQPRSDRLTGEMTFPAVV